MTRTITSLEGYPGAVRVVKRPIPVEVWFAEEGGTCETLEGAVRYEAGDAIVTGQHDDVWPVPRAVFNETYVPVAGTRTGRAGRYCKRALAVRAIQTERAATVLLPDERGSLCAAPGDWIVEHRPGDFAVVGEEIFRDTYDVLGPA